jgi:hypothetical protein
MRCKSQMKGCHVALSPVFISADLIGFLSGLACIAAMRKRTEGYESSRCLQIARVNIRTLMYVHFAPVAAIHGFTFDRLLVADFVMVIDGTRSHHITIIRGAFLISTRPP